MRTKAEKQQEALGRFLERRAQRLKANTEKAKHTFAEYGRGLMLNTFLDEFDESLEELDG